jgi:hypothetical protein
MHYHAKFLHRPVPSTIDVRELLAGNGPFGPNEVRAIADALGTTPGTHRDLRLTVQELKQAGDLSPAAAVRLGVGLYLLGRSSEAVAALKSGRWICPGTARPRTRPGGARCH